MIVHDFDLLGAGRRPEKADSILIVDPDAVLTGTVTPECFEAIAWWDAEVLQPPRDFELAQLASRRRLDAHEAPDSLALGQGLRLGVPERDNHTIIVTRHVTIINGSSALQC